MDTGWALLIAGVLTSAFILRFGSSLATDLVGFTLLCSVALFVARLDLLHPFVWYVPFFFLYHASVPILVLADVWPKTTSMHEVLVVSWAALVAFLVAVGPRRRHVSYPSTSLNNVGVPTLFIVGISFVLSAAYLIGIWREGLTSKFEIALSQSLFVHLDPAFSILTFGVGVLVAQSLLRRRIPWLVIWGSVLWFGIAFAISGERDFIARVLLMILVLLHVLYRRISRPLLLAVGVAGLLLVPVLGGLKNVLIRDAAVQEAEPTILWQRLIGDEFLTAADNLQTLLEQSPWPMLHGQTLLWDIQQTLSFGSFVRAGAAPSTQFNLYFFPDIFAAGGGRGFTLVGEGYMNFGVWGAALWFALLGLFVRFIYKKASSDALWLVIYVVTIPLVIYVTRADFSNLISQFLKHIALPVFAILLGRDLLAGALMLRPRSQRNPITAP